MSSGGYRSPGSLLSSRFCCCPWVLLYSGGTWVTWEWVSSLWSLFFKHCQDVSDSPRHWRKAPWGAHWVPWAFSEGLGQFQPHGTFGSGSSTCFLVLSWVSWSHALPATGWHTARLRDPMHASGPSLCQLRPRPQAVLPIPATPASLNSILCLNSASPAAFLGFPSLHSRLKCTWAHRVSCSLCCSPTSAELFRVLFLLFYLFDAERQV